MIEANRHGTWTINAARTWPSLDSFAQFGKEIHGVSPTVMTWPYSLAMQLTTRNLRGFLVILVASCALAVTAVFVCLSKTFYLSENAEQLWRIWKAVSFWWFVTLIFLVAMAFGLDALLRRTPQMRKQERLSKNAKRVGMTVVICSLAVMFFYGSRPFVYSENGHWISKSKAGTWEVSRDVAIDSYKRNITWDCMIILPLAVCMALQAAVYVRIETPQESE
jgi:amino acid transporter